jgi:transcription-repair coupling factor (superfamily II helicase)
MNLVPLLPLIDEMPGYLELVAALKRGGEHRVVVLDAAKPYLLACLHHKLGLPMLVVTARAEEANKLQDQLLSWLSHASVHIFSEPDALPYERLAPDPATVQQRIKALSTLSGIIEDKAPLVIASARALAQKTLTPTDFRSSAHNIEQGMKVDLEGLLAKWQDMGYERENMAELAGSFARRGGILDIYPPSSELPARIELFGNEVESIRLFDPSTQRSLRPVSSIAIVPAGEQRGLEFYTPLFSSGNIIDYLPQNALLILDQPAEIELAIEELDAQARELRRGQISRGELPPNFPTPYLTWRELWPSILAVERRLSLWAWQKDGAESLIPFTSAPSYGGRLTAFLKDTKQMVENQKKRIIIVSHQARRLSELLEEEDIIAPALSQLEEPPPPGAIALVEGSLARGWAMDSVVLLTDAELFGFTKKRRQVRRRPMRQAGFLSELAVGDYVVHIEHGIARFAGTTMIAVDGAEREYLILEYAAGDRLYVPTEQVDRVGRYIGPSEGPPALTRLGTQEWARAKQRVRQAAGELARELLTLYAQREVIPGLAFSADTTWQEELEASFPYMETADQLQAVIEIKEDMEKAKPMDRLVCGDVGYGKTEVALRAAFKAIMDGAQVAVLVPTTVLAQQHFQTFTERLGAFPVTVEVLSRFRSEREQQEVIEGLKKGTIDIVIGTHRLLQKDVSFKNLGLAVIDEEQRFGVTHKEHLKQIRKEVDVLTLTATPIPRTLHMSLSGVRDMSTMETPPEERLPIKTYIAEYDERLVREAILRELDRGGQVFFVHNRVESIYRVASRLADLVPEAEIAIGHGQMPEEELESVMLDFAQGRIDVLVSTTIIESGLDMPNVNTIIVNDADRLGLAQLYQLRGRVGRGTNRAYAYFLYTKGKRLTPQAQRRLETIFQASELGAGFRIAMRDLEIRGAGNLLGAEQSGHIGAVGFDLYSRLLAEAVEELKAEGLPRKVSPQSPIIDLPMRAHIPEEYVDDLDTRLTLYQRLAKLASTKKVDEMAEELGDRFGPMPPQVKNLLYAVKVRIMAMDAGIQSIAMEDGQLVLRMVQGKRMEKGRILGNGVRAGTSQVRLDLKRLGKGWQETLEEVLRSLGNYFSLPLDKA